MNWLKVITKSGRRSLARELLKEALTPKSITDYSVRAANGILGKVNDKEKLGKVASNVETGSMLLAKVGKAIKDGKVTPEEASEVAACTAELVDGVFTPEMLDAFIDKVVSYVP